MRDGKDLELMKPCPYSSSDLQTTIVEQQDNKAILLGYAIDPYQPS